MSAVGKEADRLTAGESDQIPGFPLLLRQFSSTMEAVSEVLEVVSPHVAGLDEHSESIPLPSPPGEGAEILQETFEKFSKEREDTDNKDSEQEGEPHPLSEDQVAELSQAFVDAYDDPQALRMIGEALIKVTTRPRREHLLHGSLLTMAVGTLETAIAGVGTQHYALHPDALPGGEKEFSLAELAEFEDLRDARALAISRRVEDLMRGGFDAWDKWFAQLLGEGFAELAADRDVLHEAIQRRHLVVHNGGRVSRQYKAKVMSCTQSPGEELPIDREYLESAIDAITIFGVRLILVAWAKWRPDDEAASEVATELVFDQLVRDRLEVARCIAETAKGFATAERQRLSLQINQWQAEKRLRGLEEVAPAIEQWDTSALSNLYAAAKAALLDDYGLLFELLPDLMEQGELGPEELREWPLFKEAREQERWKSIEDMLPTGSPDGRADRQKELQSFEQPGESKVDS